MCSSCGAFKRRAPKKYHPCSTMSVCKTIIIGGLDNVVDMRNALSEHLNVVVSNNIENMHFMKQILGH